MRNILILASAAALAVTVSAPASAGGFEIAQTQEVSYGDLNLGSSAGVAALKQRVRSAASAVCGKSDARDTASTTRARACVSNAIDGANASVDRAIATARGA